jgi:hypothetical protein
MSLVRPHYSTVYGYRWWDAIRAELWWRIEHSPLAHVLRAHHRRKTAEHRGYARQRARRTP